MAESGAGGGSNGPVADRGRRPAPAAELLVDDFGRDDLVTPAGNAWRAVSDRVMGGVSRASLRHEQHLGRACLRLSGEVRLDNDGGFLQASLDLAAGGGDFDAGSQRGLRLLVLGNDQRYSVHLRGAGLERPWQSWRAHFQATPAWREVELPFADFQPHRHDLPLDPCRLRRLGLVAIGRAFFADLRVARIGFFA